MTTETLPATQVLTPVEIAFHGDVILAVEHEGKHIVLIEPICDSLGVDYKAQLKRISRTALLRKGVVKVTCPSAGGPQMKVGLPKELIHGFVFGIKEGMVNEAARPKLIAYQSECYAALFRHFAGQPVQALLSAEQMTLLVIGDLQRKVADQQRITNEERGLRAAAEAESAAKDARLLDGVLERQQLEEVIGAVTVGAGDMTPTVYAQNVLELARLADFSGFLIERGLASRRGGAGRLQVTQKGKRSGLVTMKLVPFPNQQNLPAANRMHYWQLFVTELGHRDFIGLTCHLPRLNGRDAGQTKLELLK